MAHIPDGVLSMPVLVAGAVAAAAGVGLGLRSLNERTIPRTAILAAAFFSASLIVVPVGPSSVHLLLAGLMGLVLGVLTFPAVLVALLLQAVMFGFGGLTALGVNVVIIALPGALAGLVFRRLVLTATPVRAGFYAGAAGALSVVGTGLLVALSLALSGQEYSRPAQVLIVAYVPLMVAEALVTGFAVSFIKRVDPKLIAGAARRPA